MDSNLDFKNKYLKYKIKYLELKAQAKQAKEVIVVDDFVGEEYSFTREILTSEKKKQKIMDEYIKKYKKQKPTEEQQKKDLEKLIKKVGIKILIYSYLDTEIPPFNLLARHLFKYTVKGGETYIERAFDLYTLNQLRLIKKILKHNKDPKKRYSYFGDTDRRTNAKLTSKTFFKIFKNSLPEGKEYYSNKENFKATQKIFEILYDRIECFSKDIEVEIKNA